MWISLSYPQSWLNCCPLSGWKGNVTLCSHLHPNWSYGFSCITSDVSRRIRLQPACEWCLVTIERERGEGFKVALETEALIPLPEEKPSQGQWSHTEHTEGFCCLQTKVTAAPLCLCGLFWFCSNTGKIHTCSFSICHTEFCICIC